MTCIFDGKEVAVVEDAVVCAPWCNDYPVFPVHVQRSNPAQRLVEPEIEDKIALLHDDVDSATILVERVVALEGIDADEAVADSAVKEKVVLEFKYGKGRCRVAAMKDSPGTSRGKFGTLNAQRTSLHVARMNKVLPVVA